MSIEISNKDIQKLDEINSIKQYKKDHPDASYKTIGEALGFGKTKVARVLTGKQSQTTSGRPKGVNDQQTLEIVAILKFLAEFGIQSNESNIISIANNYLKIQRNKNKVLGKGGDKIKDKTVGRSWLRRFNNLHKHNLKPDHLSKEKLFNPDLSKFRKVSNDLIIEWSEILENGLLDAGLAKRTSLAGRNNFEVLYSACMYKRL